MQIFQGMIAMVLGLLILVYRPQIKDFTGSIGFAEQYLGSGGTWTFLIVVGVAFFMFGLMWATGTIQDFFVKNLSVFF